MGTNKEGIRIRRVGRFIGVGIFDHALVKGFAHITVTYNVNDERVIDTYDITGKHGMFIDIPEGVTSGERTFYGKSGYIYESYFG